MENPAPKPLFGKIPEEAFDHVQPGCTGRCEVHMKARVALQPVDDELLSKVVFRRLNQAAA